MIRKENTKELLKPLGPGNPWGLQEEPTKSPRDKFKSILTRQIRLTSLIKTKVKKTYSESSNGIERWFLLSKVK